MTTQYDEEEDYTGDMRQEEIEDENQRIEEHLYPSE